MRYLKKNDRSDSVSWMGFDGSYKTLRRDFTQAINEMYDGKKTSRSVAPLHTIIVSFHADELNPKRPEDIDTARLLAQSWVMEMYPDRPSLFAVQSDGRGGCVHVHIAVSNVGSDGRCLPSAQSDYRRLTRSFTEHMRSFGMTDVLHDEKGNQKYQRSPESKQHRFDDVHEKARTTGLNSWKECLAIRLDSVLVEKPETVEDFEQACARAGVVIRQPRGKGNKSWTQLKNWSFALKEMGDEAGMEDLRKTGIITDKKTKLHFVTDRGLGGSGRYSRAGIETALGWVEKPTERVVKSMALYDLVEAGEQKTEHKPKPKPVEKAEPREQVPEKVEKPVEKTEKTEKKIEETSMRAKTNDFDPEEMHKQTVESIYRTVAMLVDMGNGTTTVDEAVRSATGGSLADYREDVLAMYKREHPDNKTMGAAKPAKRSEQRPKQQTQPKQYKQATQKQQQRQHAQPELLTPEAAAYEAARDEAMRVCRGGESDLMIVLATWITLVQAEYALTKSMKKLTDAEMWEIEARDRLEFDDMQADETGKTAMDALIKRVNKDILKQYRKNQNAYRKEQRAQQKRAQRGEGLTLEEQAELEAIRARAAVQKKVDELEL